MVHAVDFSVLAFRFNTIQSNKPVKKRSVEITSAWVGWNPKNVQSGY